MQTKDLLGTRYRLDERIAAGGMGDVWTAHDELLGRRVALKLLHSNLAADDGFRRRFRAEAQAVARLSHPGIVAIYDYGEEPDSAYLAMELVDGEPLSSVIRRRGRIDTTEALSLVAQTAEALAAAHAEGLVHRDVKPANLLLRQDGRVKVTDFGIVRAADTATMTQEGTVLGTVAYMSPEQVRGERVNAASDVYSLGVVAYECLTGERPYQGDEAIAVALAHVHDPVPQLPASVPPGVRALVQRMLQKEPGSRPTSASVVAETARALAAGADTTPATGASTRAAHGRDDSAPTQRLDAQDSDFTSTATTALAGIAQPRTVLAPPSPAVHHSTPPLRHWLSVAALGGAALLVALLLATAFPGGASPANPTVKVPRLVGTTLATAEHRLLAVGLHVATLRGDPSTADVVDGEQPAPGTHVRRGASVRLKVKAPAPRHTTTTTQPPPTVANAAGQLVSAIEAGVTGGSITPQAGQQLVGQLQPLLSSPHPEQAQQQVQQFDQLVQQFDQNVASGQISGAATIRTLSSAISTLAGALATTVPPATASPPGPAGNPGPGPGKGKGKGKGKGN